MSQANTQTGQVTGQAAPAVVTEGDLLKSLETLEGKVPTPEPVKDPKVTIEDLKKKTKDHVDANGSADLKKALDVSTVLSEFAGLIGIHVDSSLEQLQKSIQAQANRDLAIVRVLEKFQKSLEDLKGEVEKLGKASPAPAANSGKVTVSPSDILKKGAEGGEIDPKKLRAQILFGLETLAKSATAGSADVSRYTNALVKFESTNQIEDGMLQEALKAAK